MPPKSSSMASTLAGKGAKAPTIDTTPLWKGPEEDGITQSMLGDFLSDRERFRIKYVLGLVPADAWDHRLGYGDMWHVCEEALAGGTALQVGGEGHWQYALREHCREECRRYPLQQEVIDKWYNVCLVQFPLYVDYWSKHPDVRNRSPVCQEQVFRIPYRLPSGRVVNLRGKWDSVDLVKEGKKTGIWLQENKTKGDIRPGVLQRNLTFDLQTMLYVVALDEEQDNSFWRRANKAWRNVPIAGVRYNVIRRPLSGGRGSIVQHKPSKSNPDGETKEHYYNRLREVLSEPEVLDEYFMRWNIPLTKSDIEAFKVRFLNPILEQLCRWYDYISKDGMDPFGPYRNSDAGGIHWQHPFGVYNPINETGQTEYDEFIMTGSTAGLRRASSLFTELQ